MDLMLINPIESSSLNSTMWISSSRYSITDCLSLQLILDSGLQSLRSGIPDSISWIPDSTAQDSRFQNLPDSGIRITVYGAIIYTFFGHRSLIRTENTKSCDKDCELSHFYILNLTFRILINRHLLHLMSVVLTTRNKRQHFEFFRKSYLSTYFIFINLFIFRIRL